MFAANMAVMKIILSPRIKITPVFYKFKPQISSLKKRVVLADSITLTPGTVTVSLESGVFTVYCLDKSLAAGLDDWKLTRMLEDKKEVK
jgi:multicomponent Na+:H+ antiporter subunit E